MCNNLTYYVVMFVRMKGRSRFGILLSVLAAGEYGFIPTVKLGFYCDDPKISHKFNGDTISITLLIALSLVLPWIGLWVVECICTTPDNLAGRRGRRQLAVLGMRRGLTWFWEYLVGMVVLLLLIDVAKIMVGEPRPHFLDTCQPDAAVNCTAGHYIEEYKCTNKELSSFWVRDSSRSFPSGHSAASVYCALFMMSFLQRRLPRPTPSRRLLLLWLHCVCLTWATFCSLSRITDRRHHWWDVLAGLFIGVFTALFTVLVQCGSFAEVARCTAPTDCGKDGDDDHLGGTPPRSRSASQQLASTSSHTSSLVPEQREFSGVSAS